MRAIVLLLLALLATHAVADDYPAGRVDIVVPYGPGGTGDVIARQLARKLEEHFGKPFIILNKPGAAGTLGATQVSRAAPDGYTLLLGYTSEIAIEPFLNASSYTPKSFEPIAIAGETPLLLIGRKNLSATNISALIELVRAKPGDFTFASAGFGSPAHIAGELFNRDSKLSVRHIPYKGGADAVSAVLGGHVDMYFTGLPPAMSLVRNGNIHAYAVTGAHRSKALPEVPTMVESGFSDFSLSGWFALLAPAGTPSSVLDKLRQATAGALSDPAVQEVLNKNGVEIYPDPTGRVRQFVDGESAKYQNLIATLGLRAGK